MRELSAERWQRLQPVLDGALELPPEDHESFLDRVCGSNAQLRRDAETLLRAALRSATFLEAPAAALLAEAGDFAAPLSREGTVIGRYRILHELGHGGMGAVYLAERADGEYDQRVALKLIRGDATSDDLVRRFLHERQILASLEHPNIARLLDGGFTADGEPYFAMELVDGEPINRWCEKYDLPIDERLGLFRSAAEAVAYAHRNLVVHRDLKPSNVLVTAGSSVKLLDFGIAKLLADKDVEAGLTRTGLYMMTPEYAAPEQVHGGAVTTATDVYMLGALLYELLSGRRVHRLNQHTPAELARVICDEEPVPPSTAAFALERTTSTSAHDGLRSTRTPAAARRLRRFLHGDLDNIVMKALRKEPERRYASVDAFIDDIDRYQKGLPVLARRDSFGYRASKFIRRHQAGVAAAALVVLSLIAGLIGTTMQARQAALESAKAEQVKNFVIDLFTSSDPDLSNGEDITARQLLARGDQRVNVELAGQPELQAEMLAVLGSIDRKLGLYDEAAQRFERALEIERGLHGPRNAKVAARLHDLGETALDQSRIEAAENYHGEALALRRSLFGEDDPEVARSLRALAAARNANGRFEDAESLQRSALAINRAHFGEAHAEVALDLEILATIFHDKGDYATAVQVGQETLTMRRSLLGDDHLETATARNNLAGYLRRTGDLGAADSLYRQVLDFDVRRLGPDHPNTATVTNNLAGVLWERGDLDEAERLFRQVLDFDRRHFGEDHRYTALVMQNLAGVLRDRRQFDESERLLHDARAIFRRVLGEDHPWTGLPVAMLASVRHERGDLDNAESLYRSAIAQLSTSLGPHPRLAAAQLGLGTLLVDRGDAAEAEPLLREALRVFLESYSPNDVRVADARRTLGQSLIAQKRFDEAEALLVTSYRTMEEQAADTDRLRDAAGALVKLYEAWQKPTQADPYRTVAAR